MNNNTYIRGQMIFRGLIPDENGKDSFFFQNGVIKGTWVYGPFYMKNRSITATEAYVGNSSNDCTAVHVASVGQFIDRYDKNGEKIFDNDHVIYRGDEYSIDYVTCRTYINKIGAKESLDLTFIPDSEILIKK